MTAFCEIFQIDVRMHVKCGEFACGFFRNTASECGNIYFKGTLYTLTVFDGNLGS